jgi:ferredoxin-NADP reductase
MLRTLADRGDRRQLRVLYGSRAMDRVIHRDTLTRLEGRLNLQVTYVLQEPPPQWPGRVGLPRPELIEETMKGLPAGTHTFICGPEPRSDMAQRALRGMGVPVWKIHHELFDMA